MEYRGYPLQIGLIPRDSETRREMGLEMGRGDDATKRHAPEWARGGVGLVEMCPLFWTQARLP